jgi:small subunit ribosomal protein S16
MLKVRLQRVGRKNDPSFRVVVTESQNGPQSGKFLEILGSYDARQGKPVLNGERIKHWLAQGAHASDTVNNMLVKFKIIDGQTINNLPVKKEVAPLPAVAEKETGNTEMKTETNALETVSIKGNESEEASVAVEEVLVETPIETVTEEAVSVDASVEPAVEEVVPTEAPKE